MPKFKALTLLIFSALPFISSCQLVNMTESKIKAVQINKPFFTYTVPEGPRIVTAIARMGEFRYVDGCLLVFNGVELLTPAFPEGDATFNQETQTLTLKDTEYKMGQVVLAGGNSVPNSFLTDNRFDKNIPNKCITENIAMFFGSYKKTTWNKE